MEDFAAWARHLIFHYVRCLLFARVSWSSHQRPLKQILRQRSHLVPGHGARVRYSLSTNVNTPFFQVPTLEFAHGTGARIQLVSTLYSGTKVGTGSMCAHNFCRFRTVNCFVLAAKRMFQNGVWQGEMEQLCTQSHIGYSKCEHSTILCRYPGTGSRAPSVGSPLETLD